MSQATDSAGIPFSGREFRPHPFEGDDGSAPKALADALRIWSEQRSESHHREVIEALRGSRVLVPLLAEAGEFGLTDEGKKVDKTQELSVVSVAGPDGHPVAVVFSDVSAMSHWRKEARPVPVEIHKVAAWAVDEQLTRIVLNPGHSTQCVLRRGAIVSLLTGEAWVAPWADAEVREALVGSVSGVDPGDVQVESGWELDGGEGPDVHVTVALPPGIPAVSRRALQQSWAEAWANHPRINRMVDGIRLSLIAK